MNSFDMAQKMYLILQRKGEVTLEDIVLQFGISVSTAYNVQRILKSLCERDENCEVTMRHRRTVFVYHKPQNEQKGQNEEEEMKRIEEILNAKPAEQ